MVSKTKGRPLPPLLPLEYCKLDRAARMLSCEVEDILHWGAIGAVKLHLMVDEDRYAEIDKHANFIAEVKKAPAAGYSRPRQKRYRINTFLDAIVTENEPTEPDILLAGLCQIHRQFIEFAYNQPLDTPLNEWVCLIHGDWATEYYTLWHNEVLTPADLYITRSELGVLYQAINTGQPLKNKYEDYDIAKRDDLEKAVINTAKEAKTERNTAGNAKATLALTKLVLIQAGLDTDLVDNPHKIHTKINELLLAHKANPDNGNHLGLTDNAFRDILSKGKSALKNEKADRS